MKELIKEFKTSKLSGSSLATDANVWTPPAELEKKITQRERIRCLILLLISNALIIFSLSPTEKEKVTQTIQRELNHTLITIKASIHLPLPESRKEKISILSQKGTFLSHGYIYPYHKRNQFEESVFKIEVPSGNVSRVMKHNNEVLQIVPKNASEVTTTPKTKRRQIYEISF